MTKFLLFCGYDYYLNGGWPDASHAAFPTYAEAKAALTPISFDWYDIVDGELLLAISDFDTINEVQKFILNHGNQSRLVYLEGIPYGKIDDISNFIQF